MEDRMPQFNRRKFLQTTSTAAAAGSVGVFSSQSVLRGNTPNERPKVAVIGCGGQGTGDGRRATNYGDIVAVCDVDTSHSSYAKAAYTRRMAMPGREVKIDVYQDYRAIIDRADMMRSSVVRWITGTSRFPPKP